jgi:hypothetical protein
LQVAVGTKQDVRNGSPCLRFDPFPPIAAGLMRARKVCRSEMAKIVNEVDLITKDPKLAVDTRRDDFFLEPMIYKHLLPVSLLLLNAQICVNIPNKIVRTWSDDMLPVARLSKAPIILGYSAPPDSSGRIPPNVISLFSDK